MDLLSVAYESERHPRWIIFVDGIVSKANFLRSAVRYVMRPPIATWRLLRVTDKEVEFVAKDMKAGLLVPKRVTLSQFVRLLAAHIPNRHRHGIRYFGLLAPRVKSLARAALFVLFGQMWRPYRQPRKHRRDAAGVEVCQAGRHPEGSHARRCILWIATAVNDVLSSPGLCTAGASNHARIHTIQPLQRGPHETWHIQGMPAEEFSPPERQENERRLYRHGKRTRRLARPNQIVLHEERFGQKSRLSIQRIAGADRGAVSLLLPRVRRPSCGA